MNKIETFDNLKKQLEAEIAWFDSDEVSLEEAPLHYKKAKDLLTKLENILKETELEITKLK